MSDNDTHSDNQSIDSVESMDDSDSWEEIHESQGGNPHPLKCLICPVLLPDADEFFRHLCSHQGWSDFLAAECPITDQYDWIKFVNCIRQKQYADWRHVLTDADWIAQSSNLYKSTLNEDPVLSIDIESVLEDLGRTTTNAIPAGDEIQSLREQNTFLQNQLALLRSTMASVCDQSTPDGAGSNSAAASSVGFPTPFCFTDEFTRLQRYGDSAVCSAYRNFLRSNQMCYFHGKRIVDLDCGHGLLTVLASQAGASHVYAIDRSAMAVSMARRVVEDNLGKDSDVTFVLDDPGLSLDSLKFPFNTILHKPLGHFLLPSHFPTLRALITRNISPAVHIFPQRYAMKLCGVQFARNQRPPTDVFKWLNMCGVRLDPMFQSTVTLVHELDVFGHVTLLHTSPCSLYTIDFASMTSEAPRRHEFTFTVEDASVLEALVAWFEVHFCDDAPCQVIINTFGQSESTSWKQAVFFLPEKIPVKRGDVVTGYLEIKPLEKSTRYLEIALHLKRMNSDIVLNQNYLFCKNW